MITLTNLKLPSSNFSTKALLSVWDPVLSYQVDPLVKSLENKESKTNGWVGSFLEQQEMARSIPFS